MSALLAVSLLTGVIGAAGAFNTDKLSAQDSVKDSGLKGNEQDVQEPGYTSSVVVSEDSLYDEAQDLTKYAKISQEIAGTAALKEVPGDLGEVSLENENGNVVYSVEISTDAGNKDVKVDAGNGKVLCVENDDENETDEEESDKED
jgi:uncharacterized membrane protein YkoI